MAKAQAGFRAGAVTNREDAAEEAEGAAWTLGPPVNGSWFPTGTKEEALNHRNVFEDVGSL